MDVLDTARQLGLFVDEAADSVGGIAEQIVLEALSSLADNHQNDSDLFAEAAVRVQLARSAGVEQVAADSVFARLGTARTEQFRYRSEMCEVFVDLAIDLGLRAQGSTDAEAGLVAQS